jgi:hypothetical protein
MSDDTPKRPLTSRPTRVNLPPSDEVGGYLLEMFELGDGPIGSGKRHAVWLHQLKDGGYRWKCSCGVQRDQLKLDTALLAEARAHFDQAWEPAAVPIGHAFCIWNDRVMKAPPPTTADLELLARDLFAPRDELAARRNKGKIPPGVEVVNICGLCGQTFRITKDDPHWSTGRGPICPNPEPEKTA